MNKIILISKDVLRQDNFSCYGSKVFNTPNIDDLAKKGTIFLHHYAAAPSTAMAFTCMFSGLNAFELNRKDYREVKHFDQVPTLFDILQKKEYACNVIWDDSFVKLAYRFSKVFGNKTTKFFSLEIGQRVGPHKIDISKIQKGEDKNSLKKILDAVDSLLSKNKLFIWIHLPHVIKGCTGYGTDIDLLDLFIGEIRKRFNDDSIYITADHGQMNLEKGIPIYGHHVYESTIKIPLITPRINGVDKVTFPTSNVQLKDIIIYNKLEKQNYIYSDSQYYLQENRKLAIIKDNYKYIYNKSDRTEELYDIDFDTNENVNLLIDKFYDRNRLKYYNLEEIYYYPYWNNIQNIYHELKNEKDRIWKEGNWYATMAYKVYNFKKMGLANIRRFSVKKKLVRGRYNSTAKKTFYDK
ncbi:MAG: sulfatase-like hydrolase/transferase [Candidatus Cloacimonetes bacterium]|nr:sulfatase-like hydrolase/transferase [Candidatus Cloacimonadota bacterium]